MRSVDPGSWTTLAVHPLQVLVRPAPLLPLAPMLHWRECRSISLNTMHQKCLRHDYMPVFPRHIHCYTTEEHICVRLYITAPVNSIASTLLALIRARDMRQSAITLPSCTQDTWAPLILIGKAPNENHTLLLNHGWSCPLDPRKMPFLPDIRTLACFALI